MRDCEQEDPQAIHRFAALLIATSTVQVKKTKSGDWLVLDGAHTIDSARTVAETLRTVFPDNPVALVVAMADDKDHAGKCWLMNCVYLRNC